MRIQSICCLPVLFLMAAASEPAHLRAARLLVAGIQPADNEYVHKPCFIHWKGEAGEDRYENHTDCSQFLNLLLEHADALTASQLKQLTGHRRPDAAQWHDAIIAGKLKQIEHLSDAQPGDVLAVKYPPGLYNTGHIMIVAGATINRRSTAPIIAATQQWDVPIVDSSHSGHGPEDTRHKPDGTFNTGVGQGVLRIYTHDDGTVAGYAWSDSAKSEFESMTDRPLIIGRLIPPEK